MKNMINLSAQEREKMAAESRRMVERRYSQTVVIGAYLEEVGKLSAARS
jgi:hypothetical protein